MTKQWCDYLFFTVIDYNIRIFLSDMELTRGYLDTLGEQFKFSLWFPEA